MKKSTKSKLYKFFRYEFATKLLYHSRQITCGMFGICYILFLKYTPKLLSKVIHIKTYVNNPELDIYMNFHALFLIMIMISIFIALKPIEKEGDYE